MSDEATPISVVESRARVRLHQLSGVGPASFGRLLETFGSAAAALAAPGPAWCGCLGEKRGRALLRGRRELPPWEALAARLESLGMVALPRGDSAYPTSLLELRHPPPVLYVQGRLPAGAGVAIVGTRRARGRSLTFAYDLAKNLAAQGHPIISGGAYGVDAAAHRGAMDPKGSTVIVLGGGLDRPYPDRHIPLFETAVERGAVVSPFRPGSPPVRAGFLGRNAVIAAVARVVVVVEAPWRSGALSTASAAGRLGRPVLAWPGSAGCERLLGQGARPLVGAQSVLAVLAGGGEDGGVSRCRPRAPVSVEAARLMAACPAGEALTVDVLAQRAALTAAETLTELMNLVISGHLVPLPGGRYSRSRAMEAPEADTP